MAKVGIVEVHPLVGDRGDALVLRIVRGGYGNEQDAAMLHRLCQPDELDPSLGLLDALRKPILVGEVVGVALDVGIDSVDRQALGRHCGCDGEAQLAEADHGDVHPSTTRQKSEPALSSFSGSF